MKHWLLQRWTQDEGFDAPPRLIRISGVHQRHRINQPIGNWEHQTKWDTNRDLVPDIVVSPIRKSGSNIVHQGPPQGEVTASQQQQVKTGDSPDRPPPSCTGEECVVVRFAHELCPAVMKVV